MSSKIKCSGILKNNEWRKKNIAIYHFNVKMVSRSTGASCVAKAAYIAGEKIKNERDGITHDYRRKHEVVHKEIMLPRGAPESFRKRSVLWNAAELKETRKNSQTARSIDAALPKEISREEQIDLVRKFCDQNFVAKGMCVDFAIHDKAPQDAVEGLTKTPHDAATKSQTRVIGNPHVHILLTTRRVDKDGFTTKDRSWNDKSMLEQWRESWANWCNYKLRKVSDERVDHRSYKKQGIDKIPTIHLGAGACAIEKKGFKTDRGILNMKISLENINRSIERVKKDIDDNSKEIHNATVGYIEEEIRCTISEMSMFAADPDYISVLQNEILNRNIPCSKMQCGENREKLLFAKSNAAAVDSVIKQMNYMYKYVYDNGQDPPTWSEIIKVYNQLRQQEMQQQQSTAQKSERSNDEQQNKPKHRKWFRR